jgi:hypothetical protein
MNMILNGRDWMTVDTQIRLLKSRADNFQRRIGNLHEARDARLEVDRIERRIVELEDMKRKYGDLLRQSADIEMPARLCEIPNFLIQRRIRTGLTQEALACRLGISRQTIVRYEKTGYARANLNNILQIDSVLRQMEVVPEQTRSELRSSQDR